MRNRRDADAQSLFGDYAYAEGTELQLVEGFLVRPDRDETPSSKYRLTTDYRCEVLKQLSARSSDRSQARLRQRRGPILLRLHARPGTCRAVEGPRSHDESLREYFVGGRKRSRPRPSRSRYLVCQV